MQLWLAEPAGRSPRMFPVTQANPELGALKALNGKRAVIVEDEGMTVWQLRKMLVRAGIAVVAAAPDGIKGVDAVLKEKPDIVLMDVTMPLMDGLEAARQILGQMHTCLVMITAYDQYRQEAAKLGACGYVVKPVNADILLPALAEAYKTFLSEPEE